MFSRRSILDKAIVLDKTCFVAQRAIMESNCLIDTELTLSTTTADKSRYKWILGLEEIIQHAQAHSSAKVIKKLSVPKFSAQLYLITSSIRIFKLQKNYLRQKILVRSCVFRVRQERPWMLNTTAFYVVSEKTFTVVLFGK